MGAPFGAFLILYITTKHSPKMGECFLGEKHVGGFSSSNNNSTYICTCPWNQNPWSPMGYSTPLQMLCPRMMYRHWGTDCTRTCRLMKNHNIPPHNDMNMWFCMWCCRNMNGLPFFDIPCHKMTMTCRFYNLKWYR